MEHQSAPVIELLELILLFGSVTYLLGAIFQWYILIKNHKSIRASILIIVLTRALTVPCTLFILTIQHFPITPVVTSLTAILPEAILSLLILKAFGNRIFKRKEPVHNSQLSDNPDSLLS